MRNEVLWSLFFSVGVIAAVLDVKWQLIPLD